MGHFLKRYGYVVFLAAYAGVLVFLHATGRFPRPGPHDVAHLIGTPSVRLVGQIIDTPNIRWNQTRFLLKVDVTSPAGFRGRTVVTLAFPRPDLGPGDRLELRGWLSAPRPATASRPFDEQRYWGGFSAFSFLKVWEPDNCVVLMPARSWSLAHLAWVFQKRFHAFWEERLPGEEAPLLLGICVGGRGRLSADLKAACIRAGVYHIMVVSGQNVALIISLGIAVLQVLRIPPRYGFWICFGPLVFYATLVGADPPVVRAVLMALVGLLVSVLGRDVPRFYPLLLAAGGILIVEPAALFGASFQLSFGATASLMAVLPAVHRAPESRQWLLQWFLETGTICLAVYIGIWPLLVYYFHRISLIGLVANWTIFPMSGVLMILGLVVGTCGVAAPQAIPRFLLSGIHQLARLMLGSIHWMARPSWAAVSCDPPPLWTCGVYYAALFSILFMFHRRKSHGSTRPSPLAHH